MNGLYVVTYDRYGETHVHGLFKTRYAAEAKAQQLYDMNVLHPDYDADENFNTDVFLTEIMD